MQLTLIFSVVKVIEEPGELSFFFAKADGSFSTKPPAYFIFHYPIL